MAEVKTLQGFIPICAGCKKIRDDEGYWEQIEKYIQEHSKAQFTHSICPDCAKKYRNTMCMTTNGYGHCPSFARWNSDPQG